MDIVTRLKEFINHESVAITQFADNCRIPRPTLSQLLNGRNKKVSDELIGKIHEAYPDLSILWLMFGEGEMIHSKTAKPENDLFGYSNDEEINSEPQIPQIDFEKDFTDSATDIVPDSATNGLSGISSSAIDMASAAIAESSKNEKTSISFNPYAKKRIVNIIVYYDDNSFESFVPGPKK